MRYWDGQIWTEHIQHVASDSRGVQGAAAKPVTSRLRNVAASLTSNEHDVPEGTLWSAIGKTLGKVTTGRYRLDAWYLYYSKGALRTEWQQVPVASVADVDVRQSLPQRTRGVYTVVVRLYDGKIFTLDDIPEGPGAQRIITQAGLDARLTMEQRSIRIDGQRHDVTNTVRQEVRVESTSGHTIAPQTVAGTVIPHPESAAPASVAGSDPELPVHELTQLETSRSPDSTPDYIAQLRDLGELRDAGILTDEEFTAKKAEIFARI